MSYIVTCGPVASGTRMIWYLVKHWVQKDGDPRDVVHWSQPQWQTFWTWDEWPDDTQFVIIIRRPDASTLSAYAGGHGLNIQERTGFNEWRARAPLPREAVTHQDMLDWWDKAIALFANFPPERTYWVSYEAMMANPANQCRGISDFLGLESFDSPFPMIDANPKWLNHFYDFVHRHAEQKP